MQGYRRLPRECSGESLETGAPRAWAQRNPPKAEPDPTSTTPTATPTRPRLRASTGTRARIWWPWVSWWSTISGRMAEAGGTRGGIRRPDETCTVGGVVTFQLAGRNTSVRRAHSPHGAECRFQPQVRARLDKPSLATPLSSFAMCWFLGLRAADIEDAGARDHANHPREETYKNDVRSPLLFVVLRA